MKRVIQRVVLIKSDSVDSSCRTGPGMMRVARNIAGTSSLFFSELRASVTSVVFRSLVAAAGAVPGMRRPDYVALRLFCMKAAMP